jgi:hypothetical protein
MLNLRGGGIKHRGRAARWRREIEAPGIRRDNLDLPGESVDVE